mmetsp:Transcript_60352/g.168628  ORF Transcript_60352/g.168628 Transcript_60352/m.168628 type:complete len:211 (-) Transcript_60352:526-1158(-)
MQLGLDAVTTIRSAGQVYVHALCRAGRLRCQSDLASRGLLASGANVIDDVPGRKLGLRGRLAWPIASDRSIQNQKKWRSRQSEALHLLGGSEYDAAVDGEGNLVVRALDGILVKRGGPIVGQVGAVSVRLVEVVEGTAPLAVRPRRHPMVRAVHVAVAVDHLHDVHLPLVQTPIAVPVLRQHPVSGPEALAMGTTPRKLRLHAKPVGRFV